mmetsp:Transcript_32581/g.56436  ORF Transcript_32581/g.56436 Transcript_32581/m.56436 type:complete len:310 (+) Transcript_32581:3453-4382(+)
MLSWSQFPKCKERISGFVVGGFGLGSCIFNLVATRLVNPNNESPSIEEDEGEITYNYFDRDIAENVPSMLRWLALTYLIISSLAVILLTRTQQTDVKVDEECSAPSVIAGVKTLQFLHLFLASLSSVFFGYFVATSYKSFGDEDISDDEFMAAVGAVSAFCNGVARIFWGFLMERTSFRQTYSLLLVIQAGLASTIFFTVTRPTLYFIWVCGSLACEGGHFTVFAAVIAKMHGNVMGGRIYGIFFYNFGISSALVLLVDLYLTDLVGYLPIFLMCSIMSVASLASMYAFKEISPWSTEKNQILELPNLQ